MGRIIRIGNTFKNNNKENLLEIKTPNPGSNDLLPLIHHIEQVHIWMFGFLCCSKLHQRQNLFTTYMQVPGKALANLFYALAASWL